MLKIWLKNWGKTLSKHYMMILMAATIVSLTTAFTISLWDGAFWKYIATTPEPDLCAICENGDGLRYQAPVLLNLSTGQKWELEIYDRDPRQPWEVAESSERSQISEGGVGNEDQATNLQIMSSMFQVPISERYRQNCCLPLPLLQAEQIPGL